MNHHFKKIILTAAVVAFFAVNGVVAQAGGFGVSPSTVSNQNLVPGASYTQTVYLVQSEPNVDLNATVTIDDSDISGWLHIENGNTFVIPKGTQQFPMKVDVNVPSNADLKKYKGTITVNTVPVGQKANGVSVVLGADIGVDLNVTDITVSDFSIQNFQIPDVVVGNPIQFQIKVKNSGNIENGPDKVSLTIFDQYHAQQLDQQEQEVTQKVPAFQTQNISVPFQTNLAVGQYWADADIYSGGKVVATSKMVFYITETPPPAATKSLISFTMPNFSAIPLWVYIAVLAAIVIIALIVTIILLLRRKPDSEKKKKK